MVAPREAAIDAGVFGDHGDCGVGDRFARIGFFGHVHLDVVRFGELQPQFFRRRQFIQGNRFVRILHGLAVARGNGNDSHERVYGQSADHKSAIVRRERNAQAFVTGIEAAAGRVGRSLAGYLYLDAEIADRLSLGIDDDAANGAGRIHLHDIVAAAKIQCLVAQLARSDFHEVETDQAVGQFLDLKASLRVGGRTPFF